MAAYDRKKPDAASDRSPLRNLLDFESINDTAKAEGGPIAGLFGAITDGLSSLVTGVTGVASGVIEGVFGGIAEFVASLLGGGATPLPAYTPNNQAIAEQDGRITALETLATGVGQSWTDSCNRSTLGSNWTVVAGAFTMATNTNIAAASGATLSSAYYSAETLDTDQQYMQATAIFDLAQYGKSALLINADNAFGVSAGVMFERGFFFGATFTNLHIITYASGVVTVRQSFAGAVYSGYVIGIGYNPTTNAYRMYMNNSQVGSDWVDGGHVVTRGVGHRETGIVQAMDANGDRGAGWDEISAYDWVAA